MITGESAKTAPAKRARRGRDEGGVRQRADGRWEVRVTVGPGKRASRYARTKTEALQVLRETQSSVDKGVPIPDRRTTVEAYLLDWLSSVDGQVRPATLASYRSYTLNHLIPALGKTKLAALTPSHVERMLSEKRKEGLSPRTVSHIRSILRDALSRAERHGLVGRNVAAIAEPPHVPKSELRVLDPSQAGRLIEHLRSVRNGAAYTLALGLGLRMGEVLGLRWKDIDFEGGRLSVRQAYQRIGGEGRFVEPKSATSRRTLPLPLVVAEALKEHRKAQLVERLAAGANWREDLDLVFAGPTGLPMNPSSTTRKLHRMLKELGLPDLPMHGLRHSAASVLIADGTPANVVAELLGHTSVSLTLGTYAQVFEGSKRQAADAIDRLYSGSRAAEG